MATDHWAVAVDTLVDAVGAMVRRWEKTETTPSEPQAAAYGYLQEVERCVLAEMKRQRESVIGPASSSRSCQKASR